MTDGIRTNPPAWGVTEDPSDLPRILRALETAFSEGRELELSALDVGVLGRYLKALTERHAPPDATDDSSR